MNNKEHEDKCLRCGICCMFVRLNSKGVYVRGRPCPMLNMVTKKCRVYPKRRSIVKFCVSIKKALKQRTPPETCGYAPVGYKCIVGEKKEIKHGTRSFDRN